MPNQPSDLKSFFESINGEAFIVLDTETTGLGPDDEICELAIIDRNGSTLFQELIKPMKAISADATRVTGISNEMVRNCHDWKYFQSHVETIVRDAVVVTYNATFDRKMFHQSDRAHDLGEIDWSVMGDWYCAMTAFAERYGNWNGYRGNYQWVKLVDAVGFYGIPKQGEFHGALADAQMTLAVIRAMLQDIENLKLILEHEGAIDFWSQIPGRKPAVG